MAREHVIRLYAPPTHPIFLSSPFRAKNLYDRSALYFRHIVILRCTRIARGPNRCSRIKNIGFTVGCDEILAEGEVVPVNGCPIAQRKSLAAAAWEPLRGGRGIDRMQILGRLLRRHGQAAAELVPSLARGRTVHGCMWVSSNGECWKITTRRADLDEHPASGLESQKEKKKT